MTESVILDSGAVAVGRVQLDITSFIQYAGVNWGDGEIQAVMANQLVGSTVLDYRLPDRQIEIPLTLKTVAGTSYSTIVTTLQQKIAQFQIEGGWIARVIDGTYIYADVINASLHLGGSTLAAFHSVDVDAVLKLECLPDWYGDEITLDTITGTDSIVSTLKLTGATGQIKGSYPARCRVIVTDTSGQDQHGLMWGFRKHYYDSASTAALVYEAEALKPAPSATVTALAGASGGNVVQRTGLTSGQTDVLYLQLANSTYLTHFGSYNVWARVHSPNGLPNLRLDWTVGNAYMAVLNDQISLPLTNGFALVSLGQIRIDRMPVTPHSWWGRIVGFAVGAGTTINIDKVYFQPISEYSGALFGPYGTSDLVVGASNITEIRHDGAYRQSASNWCPIQCQVGDMPRLPPSGMDSAPTEIFVKVSRSSFQSGLLNGTDAGLDGFNVQVKYRPSYLYRP